MNRWAMVGRPDGTFLVVERGLCLREHTDTGTMLIFPSYYRRERPELVGHPAALVSYRFNGFLDEIYATLVVRLHHTKPFEQDQIWRSAADFKNPNGIPSQSPGLRALSLPWVRAANIANPNGVAAISFRPLRAPLATTPLGLRFHSDDFPR